MIRFLNHPITALVAIMVFFFLVMHSLEWVATHGYSQRDVDALGQLIDRETMTFEQKQAAAIREIWGDIIYLSQDLK